MKYSLLMTEDHVKRDKFVHLSAETEHYRWLKLSHQWGWRGSNLVGYARNSPRHEAQVRSRG